MRIVLKNTTDVDWLACAITWTGVDLIAVHSGTSNRDFQNRRTSIDSIAGIEIEGQALPDIDLDTIVLGDFNTMGREEQPVISASQEIQILDQELASGFQGLAATPACTEYFEGGPGLLDHIVASAGMSEAASAASVTGYCAVLQCSPISGNPPPAYQRLSDHCPLMVEIANQDDDP
jgi:endonuclease/exonuclease/phosphatase family metal-dependent hydrolase